MTMVGSLESVKQPTRYVWAGVTDRVLNIYRDLIARFSQLHRCRYQLENSSYSSSLRDSINVSSESFAYLDC